MLLTTTQLRGGSRNFFWGGGVRVIMYVVSNMKWRGVWGPPRAPEALGCLGDRIMIQSNFGRVF